MENKKLNSRLANIMLYLGLLILAWLPNTAAATVGQQVAVVLLIGLGFSLHFSRLINW